MLKLPLHTRLLRRQVHCRPQAEANEIEATLAMNLNRTFRHNLCKKIRTSNRTLTKVATDMGSSPAYLYSIVRGDGNPTLAFVDQLAYALGIKPHELLKPVRGKVRYDYK